MSEPRETPPRMPRWVKWPGIVIAALIIVLVVLRLLGVQHGPGRHMPNMSPGSHTSAGTHR